MLNTLLVLFLMLALISLIFLEPALTAYRRRHFQKRDFPQSWLRMIEQSLPIYKHFPLSLQKRLQENIQVFLTEKQFIGCRGLQITEEIKLTIAAQACLLLLHERGNYYPRLRSILVYPNAYLARQTTAINNFVIEEEQVARLGESWSKDLLVLSWEQVQQDTQNWKDGHNVVLHEFAHQLDSEDGKTDGVPTLATQEEYTRWSSVMQEEYSQLCHAVERGKKTVMSAYGATAPAEFFAVATETFFEKPQGMQKYHSVLYALLQEYYRLDPLQWQ